MKEERGQDYDYGKRKISVVMCDTIQIFSNSYPSHNIYGDHTTFGLTNSTLPLRTLGSVTFLLAATHHQRCPGVRRKQKLWNSVSTGIYFTYIKVLL
jgi:hypothetical protein